MKKLAVTQREAGFFDFITKLKEGAPTIPGDKVEAFQAFKEKVFQIYKRMNNAYKIYFQGAKLKQNQGETTELYYDENGERRERKVIKENPSQKIEFIGNWKFKTGDKTLLGEAIHALYAFLTKLENTKYQVKGAIPKPAPEKNQNKKTPQQTQREKPEDQSRKKPDKAPNKTPKMRPPQ